MPPKRFLRGHHSESVPAPTNLPQQHEKLWSVKEKQRKDQWMDGILTDTNIKDT